MNELIDYDVANNTSHLKNHRSQEEAVSVFTKVISSQASYAGKHQDGAKVLK